MGGGRRILKQERTQQYGPDGPFGMRNGYRQLGAAGTRGEFKSGTGNQSARNCGYHQISRTAFLTIRPATSVVINFGAIKCGPLLALRLRKLLNASYKSSPEFGGLPRPTRTTRYFIGTTVNRCSYLNCTVVRE